MTETTCLHVFALERLKEDEKDVWRGFVGARLEPPLNMLESTFDCLKVAAANPEVNRVVVGTISGTLAVNIFDDVEFVRKDRQQICKRESWRTSTLTEPQITALLRAIVFTGNISPVQHQS